MEKIITYKPILMDITFNKFEDKIKLLKSEIIEHFSEFETPNKKFINDGIVNILEYYKSPIKIMWILKEPYDKNSVKQGDWSISDALNEGKLGDKKDVNTWKPIIFSTYGILRKKISLQF